LNYFTILYRIEAKTGGLARFYALAKRMTVSAWGRNSRLEPGGLGGEFVPRPN
jgi:hypothetical protein